MKKLIAPFILAIIGLASGIGAGLVLRPPEDIEAKANTQPADAVVVTEFVKLNSQFVIPVVQDQRVSALVIISLTLETVVGATEAIYLREPKLRDALLQVMFDHANSGGFKGVFTDGANLILLRSALLETAQKVLGPDILDVLIADILRQDS